MPATTIRFKPTRARSSPAQLDKAGVAGRKAAMVVPRPCLRGQAPVTFCEDTSADEVPAIERILQRQLALRMIEIAKIFCVMPSCMSRLEAEIQSLPQRFTAGGARGLRKGCVCVCAEMVSICPARHTQSNRRQLPAVQ